MVKAWAVARREFLERVKTGWFLVSTLMVPALMAVSVLAPVLVSDGAPRLVRTVVVDGTTTDIGVAVVGDLNASGVFSARVSRTGVGNSSRALDSLALFVELNLADAIIELRDALAGGEALRVITDRELSRFEERLVSVAVGDALMSVRLLASGVEVGVLGRAREPVVLTQTVVGGESASEEEQLGALVLGYLMWLVLYMAILFYGLSVMTSVVEEKTSHIVEVLISSMKPVELLAGKIVGVGAVGLFQMLLWGVFLGALALVGGMSGATAVGAGIVFPTMTPTDGVVLLAYFVLGYLLYAALFAATGATVSSESEARQAQFPVVLLLLVPTILLPGALGSPEGALAVSLSYIPFSAPVVMPVLWITGAADGVAVAASAAVLFLSCIGVTVIAAKVYRFGILASGGRPGIRELLRWVRTA